MGGAGTRRRGPQVGADAEVRLDLEFAEAVFGARKEITVRLPATCATCEGRGTAAGHRARHLHSTARAPGSSAGCANRCSGKW